MAMEIKGFVRKNVYLRMIELVLGWERMEGTFQEMPGVMIVSDVRHEDSGELLGLDIIKCSPRYTVLDNTNLTVEQARQLHEALGLLLEDNTKAAAEDDGTV
jgi:hypothetical protein